jgi:hypothetical protein
MFFPYLIKSVCQCHINISRPKSSDPEDKELSIADKEATFAYYTAVHDLSFKAVDCTSELISQLFSMKIILAWMKCEAVILNVL